MFQQHKNYDVCYKLEIYKILINIKMRTHEKGDIKFPQEKKNYKKIKKEGNGKCHEVTAENK